MKPPKPCQEPFSPCWCETRPNNPHCADALPIDSYECGLIITAGILIYLIINKKIIK